MVFPKARARAATSRPIPPMPIIPRTFCLGRTELGEGPRHFRGADRGVGDVDPAQGAEDRKMAMSAVAALTAWGGRLGCLGRS